MRRRLRRRLYLSFSCDDDDDDDDDVDVSLPIGQGRRGGPLLLTRVGYPVIMLNKMTALHLLMMMTQGEVIVLPAPLSTHVSTAVAGARCQLFELF